MSENRYSQYATNEDLKNPGKPFIKATTYFYAKTYIFFAIMLLATGLLTYGISYLFNNIFPISEPANATTYMIITIIAAIALVILSIIISFKSIWRYYGIVFKNASVQTDESYHLGSLIVLVALYVICLSFLLSSLSFYVGYVEALPLSILITSVLFILMSLLSMLIKSYTVVRILITVALGLVIGAGLIFLVNWILLIAGVFNEGMMISMLIAEFALLIYALIITLVDFFRIRSAVNASNGNLPTSMAVYFAFSLYNDFIYILLRILPYVARAMANRN